MQAALGMDTHLGRSSAGGGKPAAIAAWSAFFLDSLGSRLSPPRPPARRMGRLLIMVHGAEEGGARRSNMSRLYQLQQLHGASMHAANAPCTLPPCSYGSPCAAHQPSTVRPRSTSTRMRRPSILIPSIDLYASFMSVLESYVMNAYPRGLSVSGYVRVRLGAVGCLSVNCGQEES